MISSSRQWSRATNGTPQHTGRGGRRTTEDPRRSLVLVLMLSRPRPVRVGCPDDDDVAWPSPDPTGSRAMPHRDADRNLLFGMLALQNGLIDPPDLVAGFQ